MRRDLDFLREFLLELEESDEFFYPSGELVLVDGKPVEVLPTGWDWKRNYHFMLLKDAGFVLEIDHDFSPSYEQSQDGIVGLRKFRISNSGHDYLDAVRDESVWKETSESVMKAGGSATLEIVREIAVGLLKTKIKQHTGVDLLAPE